MSGDAESADVLVALGSNVGDRAAALHQSVIAIGQVNGVAVEAVSPVYQTEAHVRSGAPPQADHLNAVVRLTTTLAPLTLLAHLHGIERAAGRDHAAAPWSPRPLDLDILLWNDAVLALPGLTIPHPRLAGRRFVLAPLADVAPGRIVPGMDRTVADLLASTPDTSRVVRTDLSIVPPVIS